MQTAKYQVRDENRKLNDWESDNVHPDQNNISGQNDRWIWGNGEM
jgi:hypothetical protein